MVERAITLILIMYISHFYTQSGALQKRLVKNMKGICLHFNVPWGTYLSQSLARLFYNTISTIKSHPERADESLKTVD